MQYWNALQPATRDDLAAFGNQPFRGVLYQPVGSIGQPQPQLRDCNLVTGLAYYCDTLSAHFDITYIAADQNTESTVSKDDVRGGAGGGANGVPDVIDDTIQTLEDAYDLYSRSPATGGLAFKEPVSGATKIKVMMQAAGPSGCLTDFTSYVNLDPSHPGTFTHPGGLLMYCAPHELFHVFQNGYGSLADPTWYVNGIERSFWAESTAQWASLRYKQWAVANGATSWDAEDWSGGDVQYLAEPNKDPNDAATDRSRLYGAWVMAHYLDTTLTSPNLVRRTWELIGSGDRAKESIEQTVSDAGVAPADFMDRYARAVYGLDLADPAPGTLVHDLTLGTAPAGDPKFVGADLWGEPRPARNVQHLPDGSGSYQASGVLDLGELSMGFVDLVTTAAPSQSLLTVDVLIPDSNVSATLQSYRLLNPGTEGSARVACGAPQQLSWTAGQGTVELRLDSSCPIATLYLTRFGPPPGIGAIPLGSPVRWYASIGTGILDNDMASIGVNWDGSLIVPGTAPSTGGTEPDLGLRLKGPNGTSYDGLAPGCHCEGWGITDGTASAGSGANWIGVTNLVPRSFTFDASSIVSNVDAAGVFNVNQRVERAAGSPYTFWITVTVKNTSSAARSALYRRVMDWDVEPTQFDEYVTNGAIGSAPSSLAYDDNNGFMSPSPGNGHYSLGATGFFTDYGPMDQGAMFEFNLGVLQPGQSKDFTLFYGAAPSEGAAMDALRSVGAQVFSLGEPSSPNGAKYGVPATFFFGYKE
jgi:hypothetical protein